MGSDDSVVRITMRLGLIWLTVPDPWLVVVVVVRVSSMTRSSSASIGLAKNRAARDPIRVSDSRSVVLMCFLRAVRATARSVAWPTASCVDRDVGWCNRRAASVGERPRSGRGAGHPEGRRAYILQARRLQPR